MTEVIGNTLKQLKKSKKIVLSIHLMIVSLTLKQLKLSERKHH